MYLHGRRIGHIDVAAGIQGHVGGRTVGQEGAGGGLAGGDALPERGLALAPDLHPAVAAVGHVDEAGVDGQAQGSIEMAVIRASLPALAVGVEQPGVGRIDDVQPQGPVVAGVGHVEDALAHRQATRTVELLRPAACYAGLPDGRQQPVVGTKDLDALVAGVGHVDPAVLAYSDAAGSLEMPVVGAGLIRRAQDADDRAAGRVHAIGGMGLAVDEPDEVVRTGRKARRFRLTAGRRRVRRPVQRPRPATARRGRRRGRPGRRRIATTVIAGRRRALHGHVLDKTQWMLATVQRVDEAGLADLVQVASVRGELERPAPGRVGHPHEIAVAHHAPRLVQLRGGAQPGRQGLALHPGEDEAEVGPWIRGGRGVQRVRIRPALHCADGLAATQQRGQQGQEADGGQQQERSALMRGHRASGRRAREGLGHWPL